MKLYISVSFLPMAVGYVTGQTLEKIRLLYRREKILTTAGKQIPVSQIVASCFIMILCMQWALKYINFMELANLGQ
jgi:hypothetical protein